MKKNKKSLDFLAIGDIVIDAFIQLKDAQVHCNVDSSDCTISMRFGDKIPYKHVDIVYAVGNSPNASVSAHRLGLDAGLLTHIGNDDNGVKCLSTLDNEGVNTDYVVTENGMDTNYHFVLSYDAERTILINHSPFTYNFAKETDGIGAPSWMYFSSVAENSLPYHHEIAAYVKKNPETKLAFQPGTFQINLGKEKLKDLYAVTHVFFCNKQEAQKILDTKENDMMELCKMMHTLGPKIVALTDGPNGAWAYDGTEGWFIPMYPDPAPPVERTGAGDSFSSTFTVALALGLPMKEALRWGPVNSMNVVQHVGAQKGLLTRPEIEALLEKAPESYQLQQLI
jgi:ribokinase